MNSRLRQSIAWWQIICGALGYLGLAFQALDWPRGTRELLTNAVSPYSTLASIVFFGLCVVFGVRLSRDEPNGFIGSAFCQALQIISFALVHGPAILIQAGPRVAVTVTSDGINLGVGFVSGFFIGVQRAGPSWQLSLNFVALVWTVLLLRERGLAQAGIAEAAV